MLWTDIAPLDEILEVHAPALGRDFRPYRNHADRVANLCASFSSHQPEQLHKIGIAAAFHDLGIWTDGTFDYLRPSAALASAHLTRVGRTDWTPEITGMIFEHHKISRYRSDSFLVEAFRRADWADVSVGVVNFGLPRRLVRELYAKWPDAGFHSRLVQLSLQRLRTHPLSPLPMMRL